MMTVEGLPYRVFMMHTPKLGCQFGLSTQHQRGAHTRSDLHAKHTRLIHVLLGCQPTFAVTAVQDLPVPKMSDRERGRRIGNHLVRRSPIKRPNPAAIPLIVNEK